MLEREVKLNEGMYNVLVEQRTELDISKSSQYIFHQILVFLLLFGTFLLQCNKDDSEEIVDPVVEDEKTGTNSKGIDEYQ